MPPDRRHPLGPQGEQVAAEHLESRGYAIVDRNFRTRYGELDLVAVGSDALVFCEVKARMARPPPRAFPPLSSVGQGKQRQVRRMARQWLAERGGVCPGRPALLRFDAIGVTFGARGEVLGLDHLEDAF
jgi:putative endonuclease